MGCCSSIRKRRPKSKSEASVTTHDTLATSASDPNNEYVKQEQGSTKKLGAGDESQPGLSSACSVIPTDEDREWVITSIRATDVVLGLRRLPAGFYIVVHHGDSEWRTENKPSLVSDDAVEWNDPIPIPSDPLGTISLDVYASFEFEPMLGVGEHLRRLIITVEQLLERSANDTPFTLFPKDGEVVSPCSSISISVKQRKCEGSDLSESTIVGSHCSTINSQGELENATNQGHAALSRFRKHGGKWDLERSIGEFERALSTCPSDHPCRAAAQSNLAMAKVVLCQVENRHAYLDVPLGLYRDALPMRPAGHVDRPSTLIQLAAVHFSLFENRRDERERAQAEELLQEASELSPTGSHENRVAIFMRQLYASRRGDPTLAVDRPSVEECISELMDIGPRTIYFVLLRRYEESGNLVDLQRAIAILEDVVRTIPIWDDEYDEDLANLGVALSYRFDRLEEISDLQGAISRQRDAINLTRPSHSDRPIRLINLGGFLVTRFQRLGELSDLDDAVSILKDAMDLTPYGHPDRPICLINLGCSFKARFSRLGELGDLEGAISMFRNAVDLIRQGDPHRHHCLSNLGISLSARFQRNGELGDLEESISVLRDAVDLVPLGHPDRPGRLSNLGNSFIFRFLRFGELNDLVNAISKYREALDLTPHGHSERTIYLENLGTSLKYRFEYLGQPSDLDDSISMHRDAADLAPHDHPDKPRRLSNLSISYKARFQRFGEMSDLENAILMLRDAVDLTSNDHPLKPGFFTNLGNCFLARFERLGQLGDVEHAILAHRNAVELTPDVHYEKPDYLNNLGNSLRLHFCLLREPTDLEQAVASFRHAVDLSPHGHSHYHGYLNNLGYCLFTRFAHLGELGDIEDAISAFKDAISLTPHGHPDMPGRLNNLGNSFLTRFERIGDPSDLEDAISNHQGAVDLTPDGHPDKPRRLSNLGNSYLARFRNLEVSSDLEHAISRNKDAVYLTPHGHPEESVHLSRLADCFVAGLDCLGEVSSLEAAITLYSQAASAPASPIRIRFNASVKWIFCARRIRHSSLLRAYSVAVNLFPQLAWVGSSLTQRYHELTGFSDVALEAAATALDSGLPEIAVEWLEQGRSIVWGELLQLRNSYEELSSAHPGHASRLKELSSALEHATASREKSSSAVLEQVTSPSHSAQESLQEVVDRHRALAVERNLLLEEIRRFPGFEQFLRPKRFSELRASAYTGPVVVLNAAAARCDALIVLADVDHVIHVPLPKFSFGRALGLQKMMERLLGHARTVSCDDRKGYPAVRGHGSWESLLSILWIDVVKPVLDALAFSTPGDLTRIFWCPTGPFTFLPIHAAGLYGIDYSQPGNKLSDFVISSYIPTLGILSQSAKPTTASNGDLRLLAVRQPPSDGLSRLPGVDIELKHVKAAIRNSSSACTTLLESSVGTVEEVLSLMKDADWVHFACHGIQDAANPTASGLCLADRRRLKISDIIGLSRSRDGLAFLSACQTATGDEHLSDEAVHIAAGMLFAGYGGVVGTMWSISDKLAPLVAGDVYRQLFRSGTRPDYREAARALHNAIVRLRDANASFVEWLPFIHVGL